MVDCSPRLSARRSPVMAGGVLFALALAFLIARPAQAGSQAVFAPSPAAQTGASLEVSLAFTPTAWLYLPVVAVPISTRTSMTYHTLLPQVTHLPAPGFGCPTTSSAVWEAMQPWQHYISGAATSPDLNMHVRGWYAVDEFLGFVSYYYPPDFPPDTEHPLHLSTVASGDASSFVSAYQANDWDWLGCNCAVPRSGSPYAVTMLGLRTTPGQPLHIPSRNTQVDPKGFTAMVLYADAGQLALKYTSEDRVDTGYLVHVVNLCVDPNLVDLYRRLDADGRHWLPAVYNNSVVGTGLGDEVDVIVRDSGSFLDPRSWQDWWQDKSPPAAWRR